MPNSQMPPRRRRLLRALLLGSALALVTGLALVQEPASSASASASFAALPRELPVRRAAVMQALTDPTNPLALSPAEAEDLRALALVVVDGQERGLLRQTRMYEDLGLRWERLPVPASPDGPEAGFLDGTREVEQRLEARLQGRAPVEAMAMDIIADEWFDDLLPERDRLSPEELGGLLERVSRDCTPELAALLLPEVTAMRQDTKRVQTAWGALEDRLDRPERVAVIAARIQSLRGGELPDVRAMAVRWADD